MPPSSGFQPRNTPAERRAFFDLERQLRELREALDLVRAQGNDHETRLDDHEARIVDLETP